MKPISDFLKEMDGAEKNLKQAVVAAFKMIDEAKAAFVSTYNAAQVAMETDVAQREQNLRMTVARAVEALNGDSEAAKLDASAAPAAAETTAEPETSASISTGRVQ
jgi:hypothetical protein